LRGGHGVRPCGRIQSVHRLDSSSRESSAFTGKCAVRFVLLRLQKRLYAGSVLGSTRSSLKRVSQLSTEYRWPC